MPDPVLEDAAVCQQCGPTTDMHSLYPFPALSVCLSVPHCLCLSSALFPCSQEEMTSALATMRVDYEQIKIKKIEDASNPLLLKRRKKARAVEDAALAH